MSTSIGGTTGVTFPDASVQNTAATGFGFKNRIINGAMMIDQRNAGASVTPADNGFGTDRWKFTLSQASKLTCQQSSDAPTGFSNSLLITSSSAYSVGSGDYFGVFQRVEGYNFADCSFGTANAKTVTLSFWVKSSLTGTFGGALLNGAVDRSYPFTYTISAANTWQQKTVTVSGDTSGTWLTTNGTGLMVIFGLGVGSSSSGTANAWNGNSFCIAPTGATSVVGVNGATFYITGVQLEKGSTATSFDYRPYGTELQLCQRYYEKGSIYCTPTPSVNTMITNPFEVTKRASPTLVVTASTAWSGGGAGTGTAGAGAWNTAATIAVTNSSNPSIGCDWTASAEL